MFSSNSFGALAMDDGPPPSAPSAAPPAGGASIRLIEGEDEDAEWLKLVRTNHDVNVRVQDKITLDDLPSECSLLAISNTHNLLFAGGNSDVRVHRLDQVHQLLETSGKDAQPTSAPAATIPLPARPIWIRLAFGDDRLVIATAGAGVLLFKVPELVAGNTSPYATVTSGIPDRMLDVVPNPAAPSEPQAKYVILLASQGLVILDVEAGVPSAPLAGAFCAASWSAKGKQMVVGTSECKLVQYTPEGVAKAEIPPPPELQSERVPTFVHWLENDLFLAGYGDAEETSIYAIHRTKAEVTFAMFYDVNDTMGFQGRSGAHRHYAGLGAWGQNKHLAFLLSAISSEVGVLRGLPAPDKTRPTWNSVMLDETARAIMPAGNAERDDTSPLGLALDLTSTKPIVRGIVAGEELPDLPPAPRLVAYSQEGFIMTFDVQYPDAGAYPGMSTGNGMPAPVAAATPAPAAAEGKPAFGSSAFGQSAFGQSAFGQSATPTQSPFGASSSGGAFGQSAFGQSSTSGSAFGQSAFGQSSTPGAFGSTTPSSTPAKPAFGSSAFGSTTPSTTPAKPAFGSSAFGSSSGTSAFGQSAFGQKKDEENKDDKPAAPAFGASSPSAFGSSAFGASSSSGSAFGQSAFGQKKEGSAFGQSAFGASTGSAFGQSAFGQKKEEPKSQEKKEEAKPAAPAFGSSAFGQSAFGTSSGPAFGQSAFGQTKDASKTEAKKDEAKPSPTSAFSKGASTTSAFGQSAFGQKTGSAFGQSAFGGSSGSAFGQSAFGQKKDDKPAFTGFGKQASSGSAFGGGSAFGAGSAFAKKADDKPASNPFELKGDAANPFAKAAAKQEKDDKKDDSFGLGGLGSSLSSEVPGLAESPPSSPTTKPGVVPGLESDDEDEAPKKPIPAPVTPATPSKSTASSFIKPATAFGSTSSGFGAFGGKNTFGSSASALSSPGSGTPNAFSSKPPSAFGQPSTPGSGSAFGQSTFGSPSAFGKPAFGQSSGFGQSATPAKTAAPTAASTPTSGGGFGAFSAKEGGGFGAFSAKEGGGFGAFTGKSAFGDASAKSVFGDVPKTISFGDDKDDKKDESKTSKTAPKEVKKEDSEAESKTESKEEPKEAKKDEPPTTADKPAAKAEKSRPSFSIGGATDHKDEEAVKGYDVPSPVKQEEDEPKPSEFKPSESTKPSDSKEPREETSDASAAASEVSDLASQDNAELNAFLADDYDDDDDDYDYDEEEDEEDDGDGEYDDEEVSGSDHEDHSDDEPLRSRRSFSSLPPDMDSIPEDDETEDEDEEEGEDAPKRPKSPTWFASTGSPKTPSLLSRMGPPAQTPKQLPAFALKHAPKTSSPLAAAVVADDDSSGALSASERSVQSEDEAEKDVEASPTTRKSSLGVGLGLAGSQPFQFHAPVSPSKSCEDLKKSDDEADETSPKDEKKEADMPKEESKDESKDKEDEKTDKPAFSITQPAAAAGEWTCDTCMLKNPPTATEKCSVCDSPKPGAKPSPAASQTPIPAPTFSFKQAAAPAGEWTCSTCMLQNPSSATDKCTVCDTPKPGAKSSPSATPPAPPKAGGFAPPAGGFSFGGQKVGSGSASTSPASSASPSSTGGFAPPAGGFSFGGQKFGSTPSSTATSPSAAPAAPVGGFAPPAGGFSFGGQKVGSAPSSTASSPSATGMPAPPTGSLFGGFGKPAATPAVKLSTGGTVTGQWTCDTCMLQNPDTADKCTVCDTKRPGQTSAPAGSLSGAKSATPPAAPGAPFGSLFGAKATEEKKDAAPPAAPVAPASFSGFGGIGKTSPATEEKKDEKPATPVPAFGGFGKPSTPAAAPAAPTGGFAGFGGFGKAATPAATAAPKPPVSFGAFGQPSASTPVSPVPALTAAPLFGQSGPATPAQAPAAPSATPSPFQLGTKPSTPAAPAFGGQGQGQPLPAPAAQPAFGAFGGNSLFGTKPSSAQPSPPAQTAAPIQPAQPPAPAPVQAARPAPVQKFTPPVRAPAPSATVPARPGPSKSMGDALERLLSDVADDLGRLGAMLQRNRSHHAAMEEKSFPPPTTANVAQHHALPLSALDAVHAVADELGEQLAAVRAEVRSSDITLAQLQSRMLKSDMKTGQAEKFLKARKDPSFARAMQIKELSPAQAASQTRLRKVVQMTASRLDELDAGISSLKRRSRPVHSSPSSQPALEKIQRTVRNVDDAIRDRQGRVDDLTRRVASLRLQPGSELGLSRSGMRESSPFSAPPSATQKKGSSIPAGTPSKSPVKLRGVIAHGSPIKSETATPGRPTPAEEKASLEPTDAMRIAAAQGDKFRTNMARALGSKGKQAPVTLISRATPASTSAAGTVEAKKKEEKDKRKKDRTPSLVAHASVARGPVSLDAVPVPGSIELGVSRSDKATGPSRPSSPWMSAPTVPPAQSQSPAPAMPGSWGSPASTQPGSWGSPAAPPPSTPAAPPAAPASGGFAGIKLSFSPTTFTTPAETGERTRGSSLRSSNSNRGSHAAAARLTHTPVLPPSGSTGTLFGGVPPKPKDEDRKAPPAGFVSFSGFGK